jgi:putative NADH-flavin reductase
LIIKRGLSVIEAIFCGCIMGVSNINNQQGSTKMQAKQRILVVGATGGSGLATVKSLLAAGHEVTAFVRSTRGLSEVSDHVNVVFGDVMNPEDLDRAVLGHDAVIVTLGISENPFRVRLRGTKATPMDVRSAGTRHVIAAMERHDVKRLVVLSAFGAGETRKQLRFVDRLFFRLLLHPQIADTEVQEKLVRRSGLEWVLAQAVHLTDERDGGNPYVSTHSKVNEWKVSRNRVARFLVEAVVKPNYVRKTVAISGGHAA